MPPVLPHVLTPAVNAPARPPGIAVDHGDRPGFGGVADVRVGDADDRVVLAVAVEVARGQGIAELLVRHGQAA